MFFRTKLHIVEGLKQLIRIQFLVLALLASFQFTYSQELEELDFGKAALEYEKITQIKPKDHFANYRMGMCLLKLRRSQEALPYFDAAIAAKSDYKEAFGQRGVIKLQKGDVTGCDDLKRAVKLGEDAESVKELISQHCK